MNLRRLFPILLLLFAACSHKIELIDLQTEAEVTVLEDQTSVLFTAQADTASVTVQSDGKWRIEAVNDRASDWLSYSPESGGKGETRVKIEVSANEEVEERSAVLHFRSGKNERTIHIVQKPEKAFVLSSEKAEFGPSGGRFEVRVTSNVNYSMTIEDAPWLHQNITKGATDILSFQVDATDRADKRSGRLVFASELGTETVTVYQTGVAPEMVLSSNEVHLLSEGGQFRVDVSSNFNAQYTIDADWVHEIATKALSTNTFYFVAEHNPEYEARTAKIVFRDAESKISGTVTVYQAQQEEDLYNGPQDDPNYPPELSQQESIISYLPSSEDECPVTLYSEKEMLQMDSIALAFLSSNNIKTKSSGEIIHENKLNGYIVEQINSDFGDWGASHWAGDKILCGYDANYNQIGEKIIHVTLYREDGFQSGYAYLKLGTLNSGKVLIKVPISVGQKYVVLRYNIDKEVFLDGNKELPVTLLPGYGIVNLFPLIVYSNGYREYLNPIMIKSDPIVPDEWNSIINDVGYLFGTINGVPVFHNGKSKDEKKGVWRYNQNTEDVTIHKYQCVNLCARYLLTHYNLNRTSERGWGNAKDWPANRKNDEKNYGDKYIVLENNGQSIIREGDLIVFNSGDQYGHIGVVIKTAKSAKENYISFAHQNGGNKNRPIGSTNKREGEYVIKVGSRAVTHFIRKDNIYEHPSGITYEKPDVNSESSINLIPDNLSFGSVVLGDYRVGKFTIRNNGMGALVVSSITPPSGFRCQKTSGVVDPAGGEMTIAVRFDPQTAREYSGDCVLQTNHGRITIRFIGEGIDIQNTLSVYTEEATGISIKKATIPAHYKTEYSLDIQEQGVVFSSKLAEPKLNASACRKQVADKKGNPFTTTLTGLEPLTKYYARAYVKVGTNVFYGNVIDFTTDPINTVVPPEIQDQLDDYIPIHGGINPPNVEGQFLVSPAELVFDSTYGSKVGEIFADLYFQFSNQDMENNTLDYREQQSNSSSVGKGAFISGEGDKFSVFFNTEGVNVYNDYSVSFKTALIISGIKTSAGIKDFHYAFVLVEKGDDPKPHLIPEGSYRVFIDGDGICSVTNFFKAPSGAPARGPSSKQFLPGLLEIRPRQ